MDTSESSGRLDENGFASGEYTPKPSYYAYQNVCSIFAEDFEVCDLPLLRMTQQSRRLCGQDYSGRLITQGFSKPNGSYALAYWNPTELLSTSFESTVSFRGYMLPQDIKIVDLIDGKIYKVPENRLEQTDIYSVIKNIPVKDYPMLLTFGDFVE